MNNVGAVLGTLAAGFILMPLLGIQSSIILTAVLNIGIGIIALVLSKSNNIKKILGILIIIVIASSFSVYDSKSYAVWYFSIHKSRFNYGIC